MDNLFSVGMTYESIMSHKEGVKTFYSIDYHDDPKTHYFVYYLVSIIYTTFAIFHEERGKKPIEEALESTMQIMMNITAAWDINQ